MKRLGWWLMGKTVNAKHFGVIKLRIYRVGSWLYNR